MAKLRPSPNKTTTNVLYITYLITYVNNLVISEEMLLIRFTIFEASKIDNNLREVWLCGNGGVGDGGDDEGAGEGGWDKGGENGEMEGDER